MKYRKIWSPLDEHDDIFEFNRRIIDDHVANFHAYGGPNGPDMRPTFLRERDKKGER